MNADRAVMTGIRNFIRTIGGALGLIGTSTHSIKSRSINIALSVWPHPKQHLGI